MLWKKIKKTILYKKHMRAKNAQISFEFTFSMVIGMLVMVALLALFANKLNELVGESKGEQVDAVLTMLADEVDFAKGARAGYARVFTLPITINGENYSLNFSGTTIAIGYAEKEYTRGFHYSINTSLCLEALNETTHYFEVRRTASEIMMNACNDCVPDYYNCSYYDLRDTCDELESTLQEQCQERYCLCE